MSFLDILARLNKTQTVVVKHKRAAGCDRQDLTTYNGSDPHYTLTSQHERIEEVWKLWRLNIFNIFLSFW